MKKIQKDLVGIVPEEWMLEVPEVSFFKDGNLDLEHCFTEIDQSVVERVSKNLQFFSSYFTKLAAVEVLDSVKDDSYFSDNSCLESMIDELYEKVNEDESVVNLRKDIISRYLYSYEEYLDKIDGDRDFYLQEEAITTSLEEDAARLQEEESFDDFISYRFRTLEAIIAHRKRHFGAIPDSEFAYDATVMELESDINQSLYCHHLDFLELLYPEMYGQEVAFQTYLTSENRDLVMKEIEKMDAWKNAGDDFHTEFYQVISNDLSNNFVKEKKISF